MTTPGKMPVNGAAAGGMLMRTTGYVSGVTGAIANVTLKTAGPTDVRIDSRMGKGPAPATGETWLLDKSYGYWVFVYQVGADVPSWQDATLLGDWVNVSAGTGWVPGSSVCPRASFYRYMSGDVELRGTVNGGLAYNGDAAGPKPGDVFQLPLGYRPALDAGSRTFSYNTDAYGGTICIYPDGFVRVKVSGFNDPVFLDGIRFLAEP